jgi:hypothetical protein
MSSIFRYLNSCEKEFKGTLIHHVDGSVSAVHATRRDSIAMSI